MTDEEKSVTKFQNKVYSLCSQVPKGQFSTYKAISDALASSPRAVGQALKRNPFAPVVPCHRILKVNFNIGGFKGDDNPEGKLVISKKQILKEEGLLFDSDGFLQPEFQDRLVTKFVL